MKPLGRWLVAGLGYGCDIWCVRLDLWRIGLPTVMKDGVIRWGVAGWRIWQESSPVQATSRRLVKSPSKRDRSPRPLLMTASATKR